MDTSSNIPHCGVGMQVVRSIGDLYVLKCTKCGHVSEVLVVHMDYMEAMEAARRDCVVVNIVWQGASATTREIAAVRQLFPDLKFEPIPAFIQRAAHERPWSAGTYSTREGERIKREGARVGLNVTLQKIEPDTSI